MNESVLESYKRLPRAGRKYTQGERVWYKTYLCSCQLSSAPKQCHQLVRGSWTYYLKSIYSNGATYVKEMESGKKMRFSELFL